MREIHVALVSLNTEEYLCVTYGLLYLKIYVLNGL